MQAHSTVRVGFELATDSMQFYVFANKDKASITVTVMATQARSPRSPRT